MVVRSVKPLSVAKIVGILYAFLGLLLGAMFSLVGLAGAFAVPDVADGGGFPAGLGVFFGIGAVLFLPIFYGCIGFVFSLIGAFLYNMLAGLVGGVEIDVA